MASCLSCNLLVLFYPSSLTGHCVTWIKNVSSGPIPEKSTSTRSKYRIIRVTNFATLVAWKKKTGVRHDVTRDRVSSIIQRTSTMPSRFYYTDNLYIARVLLLLLLLPTTRAVMAQFFLVIINTTRACF